MATSKKQLASEGVNLATSNNQSRMVQVQNVENNMMQLNIDRDKYKAELSKIPESAKTMAQIRRREFLEQELRLLGKNIGSLKAKLRGMGELQSNHVQYP